MKVTMEEQKLYDDFTASVFQRGYEKGKEDTQKDWHSIEKEEREMNYKRGLDDAWECARKIVQTSRGYSHDEINEIYGTRLRAFDLTPSEAIAKIKEYEEKQKCKENQTLGYGNCSILNDTCPYDIPCAECEVHCSLKRARNKIKELEGDKE